MRTQILLVLTAVILASCGGGNQKKETVQTDASTVYVYYFHGKQRCKTCMAVEKVVKETIENAYSGNDRVKYVEVKTDETQNESLVGKYEVTWNALIIAKGDKHTDLTNDAFATAVNSPEVLTEQIKTEVNTLL